MKKLPFFLLATALLCTPVYADANTSTSDLPPTPPNVSVPTVTKLKTGVTLEKATGLLKSIYVKNGKVYGTFDYVEWYSGQNARQAYFKDHPKKKEFYGDIYMRNNNKKLRTYEISKNALISLQTRTLNEDKSNFIYNEKVNLPAFQAFAQSKAIRQEIPFHIEVTNGVVTKVTEQYLP